MLALYIGNNNVIELQALTNCVTNTVDTGATVSVTIKDTSGTDITGETWPVSMTHDTGGTYRATISSNANMNNGTKYVAHVDATGSAGEVGHWECEVLAKTRLCS